MTHDTERERNTMERYELADGLAEARLMAEGLDDTLQALTVHAQAGGVEPGSLHILSETAKRLTETLATLEAGVERG